MLFPQTSSNCSETKDSLFIVINDKEKQHILTFKKLKPANFFDIFALKMQKQLIDYQISWQLIFNPSINQLIVAAVEHFILFILVYIFDIFRL